MIKTSKSNQMNRPKLKVVTEDKLFWLENDLEELLMSSTQDQLTTIFGSKEAHSFLFPEMKDKPRKPLDPAISKQAGNMGAQELWTCLRQRSTSKIEGKGLQATADFKDLAERYDAKQFHGKVLNYSRHRLELMKKMAMINKAKSLELMKTMTTPPEAINTSKELINYTKIKETDDRPIASYQQENSIDGYPIGVGDKYNNLVFLSENPASFYSRRNRHLAIEQKQETPPSALLFNQPLRDEGTVLQSNMPFEPLMKHALSSSQFITDRTTEISSNPFINSKHRVWRVM